MFVVIVESYGIKSYPESLIEALCIHNEPLICSTCTNFEIGLEFIFYRCKKLP